MFKPIPKSKKAALYKSAAFLYFSGEEGIRTPGTLLAHTRFPGEPVQPLLHLSSCANIDCCADKSIIKLGITKKYYEKINLSRQSKFLFPIVDTFSSYKLRIIVIHFI